MNEYSQGICEDGAAILKNGQMMTIEEIVAELQERDQLKAAVSMAIDAFQKYEMDVDTYPTADHVRMMDQLNGVLAKHDDELTLQTFRDAYKAGFDHGLQCDKDEIEKLNGTSSSIRMFDYQLEHYIKDAAERYLRQKSQEPHK